MIHMHGIVWLFRLELVKGNKFIGIFFTIFQKRGVPKLMTVLLRGGFSKGGGHHERRRREFSLGV